MESRGWAGRVKTPTARAKASWAAVALALISCVVQGVNFVRTDLKPLLDEVRQSRVTVERIEQRLGDLERRIADLEQRQQRQPRR